MDIMRYDFVAPAGKHFGIVQTMEDALSDIPSVVDFWTAAADKVTIESGAISAWTGDKGRVLAQDNAALRPTLSGSEILLGDGAGGSKGSLNLAGTALGAITNLTIAGRFRLPNAALTNDNQHIFGQSAPGQVFRSAYRYANSNNYLRTDMTTPSVVQVDRDIPTGQLVIPYILTITGGTAIKMIVNDEVTTGTLPAAPNLSTFTLGASNVGGQGWRGWVGKFGIWKHAATDAQIALLKRWLLA